MTEKRPSTPPQGERQYWLDKPSNVNKVVYTLYAVSALVFAADLFYHKHGHFDFEGWFGFYGWYSFISCVLLVLAAKVVRILLQRREDYYDR